VLIVPGPYQRPVRPTDRDQIVGQLISITSTTSRRHPASQLGENFLAPPLKPPPNNSCRNRSGDPHWTEGVVPSLAESDKFTRNRKQYPNEESALKLVYLAIHEASKKWTLPIPKWREALNHFAIIFENRLPAQVRN
jgi:hypothetical protein